MTPPGGGAGVTGPVVTAYGPGPDQFLEVSLPAGEGPAPVVVVLHGGFWRARYGVELARPLAADLAARGWAAVAVEYRRVGAGGGWPATLTDVAAAMDALADADLVGADVAARLDLADVTVVGHSAGGHLGGVGGRTRPAARRRAGRLTAGAGHRCGAAGRGARPVGRGGRGPGRRGDRGVPRRHAGGAARPLRGGRPGAAAADRVPVLCVHGAADTTVPLDQSERYAVAAAAAGDRVEVAVVPGTTWWSSTSPARPGDARWTG